MWSRQIRTIDVIENYMDANLYRSLDSDVQRTVRNKCFSRFEDDKKELKAKIKAVFAELRKEENIYARMNFACCGDCGSYELGSKCKEDGKKKGYAFYHRQAAAGLEESGHTYIYYGSASGDDDEVATSIAKTMVKLFQKHGVSVKWDGDINTAVLVAINKL